MRSQLFSLLVFVLAASTAVIPDDCHKLKEALHAPPQGWVQQSPAPPHHVIELSIAIPQSNSAELDRHLYEVSDPSHSRYGQHLSKEEVEALIRPTNESIQAVHKWLASHGLSGDALSRTPADDWVSVRVPVSQAEKMLDTKYHIWTHAKSGDSIVRTTGYSLPESIHPHIEFVQPTTMFAQFKAHKSTTTFFEATTNVKAVTGIAPNGVPNSCANSVSLACIQKLYNSAGYVPKATNVNQFGITGYLDYYANAADFDQFLGAQIPGSNMTGYMYNVVKFNGGKNLQALADAGGEADLDTQLGFGISYPTPGTFYTTAGSPPFVPDDLTPTDTNEPYQAWLNNILALTTLPQTISTSYGDDEQSVPLAFALRVCDEFRQLGVRGVSVIFSSGDGGPGDGDSDPTSTACFTNDGKNTSTFLPVFPASCPYVTTVGATTGIYPEVAADFSGGGFSNYFARPSYQDAAVSSYLTSLGKKYAGLYNVSGRGYPDVASQGVNMQFVWKGKSDLAWGTSAAAPVIGGLVTLLNDARLAAGKSSLGFLNTMLYSSKGQVGLTDITSGHAPGCGTKGFTAVAGWDPITGLGTPKFDALLALALSC